MILPAAQVASEQTFNNEQIGNCPDPAGLIAHSPKIKLDVLEKLRGQSILSSAQFDKELLCELLKLAAYLQLKKFPVAHALEDRIMAAAFFEPSTRTRLSFESAMLHLGGKTISVSDAKTTGVAREDRCATSARCSIPTPMSWPCATPSSRRFRNCANICASR
ncbi:MAG: hypothetical protein R3E09_03925 [Novosphingobium sp.]